MDEKVLSYPLELLDWLIVNEVEGKQIANCQTDDEIPVSYTHLDVYKRQA